MPVKLNPNIPAHSRTKLSPEQRQQKKEEAAVAAGGAAGLSTTATRMAGKKGIKAEAGEKALQHMMETVSTTTRNANNTVREAEGLWGAFNRNVKMYAESIMKKFDSLKNTKFIGPLINSPITKKLSFLAGGVLAFFVLITGINKMIKTGTAAVKDLHSQYNDFRAAA
ncbi:hypothetical protein IJ541_06365 [bacterium]|nr:hypothetical protein [bacterium]